MAKSILKGKKKFSRVQMLALVVVVGAVGAVLVAQSFAYSYRTFTVYVKFRNGYHAGQAGVSVYCQNANHFYRQGTTSAGTWRVSVPYPFGCYAYAANSTYYHGSTRYLDGSNTRYFHSGNTSSVTFYYK